MTPSWGPLPHFQIVVDPTGTATTYTNDQAFHLTTVHPENNIASAVLQISDYQNKNFESVFSAFDLVDIYFYYGSDTPTKMMRGTVHTVAPSIGMDGEVLEVGIWGNGLGLLKTHCNTSYGKESIRHAFNTPQEIISSICQIYVEKQFDGAVTNWTLGTGQVENVLPATDITFLDGRYTDNFTLVNKVCDITTAYAVSIAGVGPHWMVDASDNLYFKQINADSADTTWPQFWKGTGVAADEANSTLTVTQDMILYDFKKHMTEYANHILLVSNLRKPGYDYWTEHGDAHADWGTSNCNLTDSGTHIVGDDSLLAEPAAAGNAIWYYPGARNLSINFENIGSENSIPTVEFFARCNQDLGQVIVELGMGNDNANYFYINDLRTYMTAANEWFHVRFPCGPLYTSLDAGFRWIESPPGGPLWTDIDYILFSMGSGVAESNDLYIDDLHITGKLIREAKDTSEIITYRDHQKVIINDTAIDDTLHSGTPTVTDIGTAARLAYAELLRRATLPLTAMIKIPLAIDFLPGQKTHIHAARKADGTFRIDSTDAGTGCFRAVEVTHSFGREGAFTTLNLTNDVTNSHAKAVPTQASLLAEYVGALGHREAKNLKGGGIDPLIPRLTESY